MSINENGYPPTPGLPQTAARLVASLTAQDVAEKQEGNLRAVIDAASWVVKLFGTHDPQGQAELREEVDKLRSALRVWRRDNHPHVTALKTGLAQQDEVGA